MCTDLVANGGGVLTTNQAGPPPAAQGGAIVDGVYDLTEFTYYNSGGGGSGWMPERETIRISSGGTRLEYQADHALSISGYGMVINMAPAKTALNDTVVCPPNEPYYNMFVGPWYTATLGQFVSVGSGYVKVFVKRP
jgi:hypothetical protein